MLLYVGQTYELCSKWYVVHILFAAQGRELPIQQFCLQGTSQVEWAHQPDEQGCSSVKAEGAEVEH